MFGRVLAVGLLTALTALPAVPQCTQSVVFSDPFRSTMLDIAVDGNDLWAATSYGVALFDRTVDLPNLTAMLALPDTTRIVRLSGGLAYLGSGNTINVVRRNGNALELSQSIDTGVAVNDLLVTTRSLFAATPDGIVQYDLLDPAHPVRTPAVFPTSQPSVNSLALIGNTLYAADGDGTVEMFDITTLQSAGSLTVPGVATALHTNNGRLYVSSPVQTTVFISGTNAGSYPLTTVAMAPISGDAFFFSTGDRTLRGLDATHAATPLDIFRDDLPATGGNVNRIGAMVAAGDRLYVAAGDIGLIRYDIAGFSPFPLRGVPFEGASSVVSLGDRFYAGGPSGVTEFTQLLVQQRSWDGSRADTVQDGAPGFLLTSSGQSLTLWTLNSTIPQPVASATLPTAITGAVLVGSTMAYVILADRSYESVDFTQAAPVPQKITVSALKPSSIARSGDAVLLADARNDGTTQLAYFSSPDAAPQSVTVPGLPTSGVTLSGTVAALQTFRGISVVDFGSGSVDVLSQSNDVAARQLLASGSMLLELANSTLRVWNLTSGIMTGQVTLPSEAIAVSAADGSNTADVVTSSDVVTVVLDGLARMPLRELPANGNSYYRKIAVSSSRVYLAGAASIDIFSPDMQYGGSIRAPGLVDLAASETGVFTLSNDLSVHAYSIAGAPLGSATIDEGSDAQALSIDRVDGALWVSLIHGCTSGGICEKKTLVFDPAHLTQTASMPGAVVDVVTSGSRAYAITDFPSELRIIDLTDGPHPSIVASTTLQGNAASVSYASGTLYVLGDMLTAYSESSLAVTGAFLAPAVTNPQQRVRIAGTCAVVIGRASSPQEYTLPEWIPASSPATPAPARAIAVAPGRTYVLTDQSLEIWSDTPLGTPLRRHAAR